MSSDESTSTQISAISSQLGIDKKLKPHKSEQWEINLIGNFLLRLYHRNLITPQNNWIINKSDIRKEFKNFLTAELKQKLQDLNGTDNIGTLLHRCGFLINTVRGSSSYRLKDKAIYDFRNKKLKEQDNWRLNNDVNNNMTNSTTDGSKDNVLINLVDKQAKFVLEEKFEIYKDEPKNLLEYQGTTMQERQQNYYLTNMSCSICEEDFSTMELYEEHIQKHNDETEFEFLNTLSKHATPIFTLSYRLCKNSHYFCFDIETTTENLVIEKIIIVQSRSLYYVHNMRVPYSMPESGCEQFFVDSHLFTKFVEQPIVLVCHIKDSRNTRIIEEHHFMRCEEFPKVNFAINPYRLPDKKQFKPKFQLADYFPPKEIQEALKDDFYNEKLMRVSNEFRDYVRNEKKLQPQTIGPSLNILLQIEDLDTLKQYFNLTQRGVELRCFGNEYSFRLRTKQRIFIENILTVFDEVILTTRSNISTKPEDLIQLMLQNKEDIFEMTDTYVGQIEDVNSSRISFKCYRKIDTTRTYTVICRPSRLNIRYQYRSLEMLPLNMHFLKNFLFPAQIVPRPLSTISLTLYNKSISGNPEQLQTVRNIAEGPRNDATYIIFGPPGTGKTTTVVESILQVLKRPDTKILVTASSNSACDEVAIRLCKQLNKLDMGRAIVRIYSRSSENRIDTIDDELLKHSNMYNGQFYPDIEILHEYRIVVCTLSIVAKLATGKFGRHDNGGTLYTHVFIDEVAATMEAEALIGITAILTPKSSLIIAGDHRQLGPILQSKRAEELGLGASLMDRLMTRECYRVNTDTGDYDRTIQTRLRLNFRSHPAIVNLYSGMYYNHGLEPKANIDDVNIVNRWHGTFNKDYPIIFHCVDAPSYCDNQSKSLYNQMELNVVMDYVKDLMYFGINNEPVEETDIGIISPYKKQYRCIQEELNLRKWFKIETGSVETFQGKEKNIIIVSFVRSGTPTLGFLENPRRLNVTISRAKSLLIMIGNPKTLSLNSDFEYIIKECRRHNTIVGSSGNRTNYENKQNDNAKFRQQRQNANAKPKPNADVAPQMSALNNLMQQLNVTNPQDNANNRRSEGGRKRNRGRRGGKSKNNQQSNKQNKENNSDEDDDDDDDSDVNTIDGDDKPSSSGGAGSKRNQQNLKNIKSHQSTTIKSQAANSGKISKNYNKGTKSQNETSKNKNKSNKINKTPGAQQNNNKGSVKNVHTLSTSNAERKSQNAANNENSLNKNKSNKMDKITGAQQNNNNNKDSVKNVHTLSTATNQIDKKPISTTTTSQLAKKLQPTSTSNNNHPLAIKNQIANTSTSTLGNNNNIANNNQFLNVKSISSSNIINTTVSSRPTTTTTTSSSSSTNWRQLSNVSPAAQTTNSAYADATSSNLSSTGAIRKLPISQTTTSSIATASVRPVIRQTSATPVTPTIAAKTLSTSSTNSTTTSNFRTNNNNFIDSYNAQARASYTTLPTTSNYNSPPIARTSSASSASSFYAPPSETQKRKNNDKCVIS